VAVAEELRAALAAEDMATTLSETPFNVTCCFGVAQMKLEDLNGGSVFARADVALYRAKAGGRNRVELDGPP
jgi:two-component system cell cycle response regulator